MTGFHVFPETATESHPGQVPRRGQRGMFSIDPTIDPARPAPVYTMDRFWAEEKPVLRSSQIAADLGLPLRRQKDIELIVKNHARSENELRFRQGVMSQLLHQRIEPILRSKIMNRALSYYRHLGSNQKRYLQQKVWKSAAVGSPHGRGNGPDPDHEDDKYTRLPIDIAHNDVSRRRLQIVGDDAKNVASFRTKIEPRPKKGKDAEQRDDEPRAEQVVTPRQIVHLPNPVEDMKEPDRTFAGLQRRLDKAEGAGTDTRDGYLRKLVKKIVESAGVEGCLVDRLAPLVHRYGAKEIANAIRALGAYTVDKGRIHMCKSTRTRYVIRNYTEEPLRKQAGPPLQPGLSAQQGTAGRAVGGAFGGSAGLPVGTQKVWNKRIVEKKEDGKWHVVGHIAGLEDPRKTRLTELERLRREHGELQVDKLSREQAQHLIDQLKQEKKDETDLADTGAKDGEDRRK